MEFLPKTRESRFKQPCLVPNKSEGINNSYTYTTGENKICCLIYKAVGYVLSLRIDVGVLVIHRVSVQKFRHEADVSYGQA